MGCPEAPCWRSFLNTGANRRGRENSAISRISTVLSTVLVISTNDWFAKRSASSSSAVADERCVELPPYFFQNDFSSYEVLACCRSLAKSCSFVKANSSSDIFSSTDFVTFENIKILSTEFSVVILNARAKLNCSTSMFLASSF